MSTVTLRNTNPLGDVDLPLIGRVIGAGETFEIDSDLAGRAPSVTKNPDTGEDVVDPGTGLLAQVGNYELVAKTKEKGQ